MIFWCLDSDCAESQDAAQSSVEAGCQPKLLYSTDQTTQFYLQFAWFCADLQRSDKNVALLSLIMTFYYNEVTLDHKNNLFSVCTAHVVNFLNIFKSICIYMVERDECFKGYLEQFQSKKQAVWDRQLHAQQNKSVFRMTGVTQLEK